MDARKAITMAGALLLLAVAPAHAQDSHGAMAAGQTAHGESVAYGFAAHYATKDEAVGAAMNACRTAGGMDCTTLGWFQNSCGALAMDLYGMAQGKGAQSQEQAETRALRSCEAAGGSGCAIVGSQCVEPGAEPDTWSGSESVQEPPEEKPGVSAASAGEGAEQPAGTDAASERALTREERFLVQRGLAALGYDPGPADGLFGPRTRSAIWEWQEVKGIEATGYLTREQAEALVAADADAPGQAADPETEGAKDRKRAAAPEAVEEPRRSQNQILRFPLCEGMPRKSQCWRALPNKPGCRFWTEYYLPKYSVTWSGGCDDDIADGQGILTYVWKSGFSEETGELVEGKKQGRWVKRLSSKEVVEAPYVDGNRHGHWIIRDKDGRLDWEGHYVHGYLQDKASKKAQRSDSSTARKCPDGSDYNSRYRAWKRIMRTGSNEEICGNSEYGRQWREELWPADYSWCTDPCALR